MTKYISCSICENRKGPLFAIPGPVVGEKQYVCKRCMERLKAQESAKKSTPIMKP